MATAESIVRAGRAQQIELSKAASRRLISAYRDVWADINSQLAHLQQQIAAAQKAGEPVRVSWLYQQQRLQQLQLQVGDALTRFTGHAQQLTLEMIQQATQDGATTGYDALQAMLDDAGLPPGVQIAFNRLNFAALDDAAHHAFTLGARALASKGGKRLEALYRGMPADMAKRAKRTILYAVATGQHPSVTARQLRQQMGIGLNHALTVARTEQLNAYRRANLATFRANDDVCNSWTWLAAPSGACPFCTKMNGTKHLLTEEMDSHPRCRCVPQPNARSLSAILMAAGINP